MATDRSIGNKAREEYRRIGGTCLLSGFALFSIGLLCAASCMVSMLLGAVTICLLFLPFLFSLTNAISYYAKEKSLPDNRITFMGFAAYFTSGNGVYRVFLNLAKALGFLALGFLLTFLVYGLTAYQVDPSFRADYDALMAFYEQGNAEAYYDLAGSSVPLSRWSDVAVLVGDGCFLTAFAIFVSNYGLNPFFRAVFPRGSRGLAVRYYNYYFNHAHKDYYRLLWTQGYAGALLVPLGFGLGAGLSYAFGLQVRFALGIGVGVAFLVLALYIPYYLLLIAEFYSSHPKTLLQAELDIQMEFLLRAQSIPGYGEEEIEKIRQDILDTRRKIDAVGERESEME
ncbi:MAG: hypothetical protein K6E59_00985 [Bacilli bacterium]|nr:hypothetical protein [Bacilli bacterium]